MAKQLSDLVPLGTSDVRVSPVGMGAWSWGGRMMWGGYTAAEVNAAFETAFSGGITFVDTAEAYGRGTSEKLIGAMPGEWRGKITVATKFFPYPWRFSPRQFQRAVAGSLKRLLVEKIDLYQIHWPIPPMPIETWLEAMADAVQAGKVKLAGVSNYDVEQTRTAYDLLKARGIPLTSNQVQFSLIQRKPESSGLLGLCKELGVTLIAYSPIGMGVLTGKYTPQNPPPGMRGRRYPPEFLEKVQPLIGLLREIGEGHPNGSGGKTPAQVAINWTVAKGALPIPGARNKAQAEEIAGTLGWALTPEEVKTLDKASDEIAK